MKLNQSGTVGWIKAICRCTNSYKFRKVAAPALVALIQHQNRARRLVQGAIRWQAHSRLVVLDAAQSGNLR
jgi:hypothetical protein